jgi:hypothetical protein
MMLAVFEAPKAIPSHLQGQHDLACIHTALAIISTQLAAYRPANNITVCIILSQVRRSGRLLSPLSWCFVLQTKSAGWVVQGDTVVLPANAFNTAVQKRTQDLIGFDAVAPVLKNTVMAV